MPDLHAGRDDFESMIRSAGWADPLGAVEHPSNPEAPCWCGSGVAWLTCHKGRDKMAPVPFGQANVDRLKCYLSGPCLHPDASAESCSTATSIQSHTIQRRGGLAAIAEDGHVYSTKKAFQEIDKRDGQVDMAKVGVGKASTFPGFCSHHDTELFRPVEQPDSTLNLWSGFLLSFRAVSYEVAAKEAQLRSHKLTRATIDYGRSFAVQAAFQNFLHLHQGGIERGLQDTESLKDVYDSVYRTRDLGAFRFFGVEFDCVLPFAAAGAFMPEFDFGGKALQHLGLGKPAQQIALNVTQLGGKTCVGFGWFGGPDSAAGRLVQSFKSLPDAEKANAVLVLALEHLENFFCTPSWWESLPADVSARLHEKIAGGLPIRLPSALVEPGLNAVQGGVQSTFEA